MKYFKIHIDSGSAGENETIRYSRVVTTVVQLCLVCGQVNTFIFWSVLMISRKDRLGVTETYVFDSTYMYSAQGLPDNKGPSHMSISKLLS